MTDPSEAQIRDLCADLAPGVRLTNGSIGFADIEFEHFVRTEAEAQLGAMQTRVADHFVSQHRSDAYAEAHIAAALLVAGRGREIIDLINTEREPTAIRDPVLRREAQLQRLRIAMKVCREAGNNVDAMLTLLIGAEALKTDATIQRMLIENPDLAANFAHDPSSRIILRDPNEIENHGPLLFHLMAADGRNADGISVREGYRQVRYRDIAAETEAVLRIAGPRFALESVLRWRPRAVALCVASILSFKLIISGETSLVERCITEAGIQTPWDLFLLAPLALAGQEVDLSRLESSLASLLRRRLIRLDKLKDTWRDDNATAEYLDMILTACEVVVARSGDRACVVPVLERIADREWRRLDRFFTSQVSLIDFSLRAHALLERLAGRKTTLETYWVEPPAPLGELPPEQVEQLKRSDGKKKEELQAFVGPLMDIYDIRAQALIGSISVGDVDTRLRNAIAHYHSQEYRLSRDFSAREMRTRAALSITRLMALRGLDRTVLLERASSVLSARSDPFGSAETHIFASLALDRSLHQQILSAITDRARAVRSARTSAEDKLTALIRFARLLLPISYGDAKSLFNEAVEVAGEVNVEAVHEIALFSPLAEHAVGSMGVEERRVVARDLAIVVGDAGVRLAGYDYFPWAKAAQALTTLDVCLALAATARWEDSSIVDHTTFLPPILEKALHRRQLSPTQVSALSSLLDQFSVELMVRIIEQASEQREGLGLQALTEDLAWEELLRFGRGARQQVSAKLTSLLTKCGPGFWLDRLVRATSFQQLERPGRASPPHEEEGWRRRDEAEVERHDPLDSLDWAAHRFVSAEEINDGIGRALAAARASDTFIFASTILGRIRSIVALSDRGAHLEALSCSEYQKVPDYERAQAIAKGVEVWHEARSISRWCRERLVQVVVDLLPGFSRWLANGESPLPALLEKSGVPAHQISAALLDGMERHVDALNAPTIYALVGLVARYCVPDDAAQVMARYADRLVQRTPVPERDNWHLADIPTDPAEGMARFLYAFMGDVDVRTRWRVAHALRRLVRLGDANILDKLVELYGQTSESSYRKPDAPFYWLAARLWLVIALNRIAAETPSAVGRHGQLLLEIANDDEFPHVLVRSFAKSAVCKLVESGTLALDLTQRNTLKRANISLVGWLIDVEQELGIDERDPLRYLVRAIECRPSRKTATALNLEFVHTDQARWLEASCRNTMFVYEAWGDNRGDEPEDRLRYDETVRSSGWRLRANKEALRTFLNQTDRDLIVEIEITRRNKGYDYSRYDEEGAKEVRSDRVFLLRRDGTIEAAEGCLGTWTAPRP